MYDIIAKSSLTTIKENGVRLVGKLEWHLNYKDRDRDMGMIKHSHVTITFSKVGPIRAMEMYRNIAGIKRSNFEDSKEYYVFNEGGVKVHVSDDTLFKHFKKAIRHLYGFTISEMAENGVSVIIDVTTDEDE